MRYLIQMSRVLAALLNYRKSKEYGKALELIEEVYNEMPDVSMDEIHNLEPQALLERLTRVKNLNLEKIRFIAELLFEEGEIFMARTQDKESRQSFKKALFLLEYIDRKEKVYSEERITKLEYLRKITNAI